MLRDLYWSDCGSQLSSSATKRLLNKDRCSHGAPQGALSQILGIDDEVSVAVTNEAVVGHPTNDLNREPTVLAVL